MTPAGLALVRDDAPGSSARATTLLHRQGEIVSSAAGVARQVSVITDSNAAAVRQVSECTSEPCAAGVINNSEHRAARERGCAEVAECNSSSAGDRYFFADQLVGDGARAIQVYLKDTPALNVTPALTVNRLGFFPIPGASVAVLVAVPIVTSPATTPVPASVPPFTVNGPLPVPDPARLFTNSVPLFTTVDPKPVEP